MFKFFGILLVLGFILLMLVVFPPIAIAVIALLVIVAIIKAAFR